MIIDLGDMACRIKGTAVYLYAGAKTYTSAPESRFDLNKRDLVPLTILMEPKFIVSV